MASWVFNSVISSFYDLFILNQPFGELNIHNDVCWNRPQRLAADIRYDSRDQKEVVEHGISFIFGKGLLLKSEQLLC